METDEDGVPRIKRVPVTGGELAAIPTPWPGNQSQIWLGDISPDHNQLLVQRRIDANTCSVWSVPLLSASSPRPLVERATCYLSATRWSRDGQMLAYALGSDLFLAHSDGTEPHKLLTAKGGLSDLDWSPDGRSLRFTADADTLPGMSTEPLARPILEVSTRGRGLRAVISGGNDVAGKWTPDGRYFLFLRPGDTGPDLWAIRERDHFSWLRTSKPIQLTAGPLGYYDYALSPDGKKAFVIGWALRGEVQRFDRKSGKFEPFLRGFSADCCSYSQDGKWIAYVTYPEGTLFRSRVDGSERQQLTWPPLRALNPFWSPDGKQISFTGSVPGKEWRIFLVFAEGGSPRPLTQSDCTELDATWSADQTHIVFGGFSGNQRAACSLVLYSMDTRTHEISIIPGSEGLWSPRWSPDGAYIVALKKDMDGLMVYELAAQKWSELVKLRAGQLAGHPTWSADGEVVYFAGMGGVFSVRLADHRMEEVADLSGIAWTGNSGGWLAIAPDGSPLILRDVSLAEIYALDIDFP